MTMSDMASTAYANGSMASGNGSTTSGTGSTASTSGSAPSPLDAAALNGDDHTLTGPPLNLPAETVAAIKRIVHEETMRTMVMPQFLPISILSPKATTVPLKLVTSAQLDAPVPTASGTTPPPLFTLAIDDGLTIRVTRLSIEFAVTDEQVIEARESPHPDDTSFAALARQAAKLSSQVWDAVFCSGAQIFSNPTTLFSNYVRYVPGQTPIDGGLLGLSLSGPTSAPFNGTDVNWWTIFQGGTAQNPNPNPYINTTPTYTPIKVPALTTGLAGVTWGDNTLTAVAQSIAFLTDAGNPGPFALVLHTNPFSDLTAPAGPESLAITLDRVAPYFKAGVFSTNVLPSTAGTTDASGNIISPAYYTGVIVSVGGNAVSLAVGQHAKLLHLSKDNQGNHRVGLFGRMALLVNDVTAIQPLVFQGLLPS
jgi:hypothetical protein